MERKILKIKPTQKKKEKSAAAAAALSCRFPLRQPPRLDGRKKRKKKNVGNELEIFEKGMMKRS